MTLERRSRKFRSHTLTGYSETYYRNVLQSHADVNPVDVCEHQVTWSEGHPWPKGKGEANIGGPFDTIRTRFTANPGIDQVLLIGQPGTISRQYRGNMIAVDLIPNALRQTATDQDLFDFVPSLGDSTLGAMGATAISNSAPTNPVVDGAVSLAELYREGIPSLIGAQFWKDRARAAKAAGSEYLNIQFGWLPLVSDIQDAAKAVIESERVVKQLLRDSGKNVRRHYTFPETRTIDSVTIDSSHRPWPYLSTYNWTMDGNNAYKHTTTKRSVWFDGCFTYYLDKDQMSGLEGAARQARLIYGVKLTPDVIWNILPWSWLFDWFVNIGPVMRNLGLFANDGLTLRYGYTMETTNVSQHWSWPRLRTNGLGTIPSSPSFTLTGERKRRLEQSPFVLGLTGAEFTLRRASILTALGLTKFG